MNSKCKKKRDMLRKTNKKSKIPLFFGVIDEKIYF
jgi:hypothetical protein